MIQRDSPLRGDPMQTRQRLIESANRFHSPDDHYGYGLPNMVLAAQAGLKFLPLNTIVLTEGQDTSITAKVIIPPEDTAEFVPMDFSTEMSLSDAGFDSVIINITPSAAMEGGRRFHLVANASFDSDTLEFAVITKARQIPFYFGPNPFTSTLTFYLTSPPAGNYRVEIFTLSGELVYTYIGTANPLVWDGRNLNNENVASGVYIIRYSADGIEEKVKVFKL